MIEHIREPWKREQIENVLHPYVREWFFSKFKDFSLPQLYGVMEVHNKNNILISAPTGSTKTLTSTLAIINELVTLAENNILPDEVYCVYTSPLRALNNDLYRNLLEPLNGIKEIAKKYGKELSIRIAVRTGDTTDAQKQRMLKRPPHILVCTPETLAIVLTSIKFKELLRNVKYCIVDEIHSVCENKRGVHLSLSLERLQDLSPQMTRIGLSATCEPLDQIAQFLVGTKRNCKVANVQFLKKLDLKVISPLSDLINTTYDQLHDALYNMLDNLIQEHKTTLVFTNTRAGTERIVHHLKTRFPKKYTENIGAHHGSLSRTHRLQIEERLKNGELRCVCSSTSLELGLDIGYIDLVICIGSPKSIARLLQRCLPYHAKVLLADGTYKEIGEIVEKKLDVRVLSYDPKRGFIPHNIVEYHKNEAENITEIKLHSGSTVECTDNHPVLTRSGWMAAGNLRKGDEVAEVFNFQEDRTPYIYEMLPQDEFYVENKNDFLRNVVDEYAMKNGITRSSLAKKVGIKQNHLQNYIRKNGRRKSIRLDIFLKIMTLCRIPRDDYLLYLRELKSQGLHRTPLPLKMTRGLMWFAGIVASDGAIVKHQRTGEYKIKIGNKDLKLLRECQKILNQFGFYQRVYVYKPRRLYNLECGSKLLAQILLALGLKTKKKSTAIEVSHFLYRMSKKLIIPFIEGVIEGDGNVTRGGIRIFSASSTFVQGIHNILNHCGIHNYSVRMKAKPSKLIPKINSKFIYCLYISRNRHIQRFLVYCTFRGKKMWSLLRHKRHYSLTDLDTEKNIHWTRVISTLVKKQQGLVYNLTLDNEPNTYIVDSVLMHNCGRAGHALHETVNGRIIVMDRDDLVECAVMLKLANERKIDKIHIPENCLDVLAQQVYGMAIQRRWNIKELYDCVTSSYCYRNLSWKDFMDVMSYLSGEFVSLEDRNIYAKVWYNKESGEVGRRGRMSRVIYMTNVGTIPDETSVVVKVREQPIGTIDEAFLERLKRNDVFVLGGDTYQFLFSRGMVAQVMPAHEKKPTVPSWFSEMLPLSFDVANEIQRFRRYVLELIVNKKPKEEVIKFIHEYTHVDENAAHAIYSYILEKYKYIEVPHDKRILIENFEDEKGKKYAIFHALYGRRVNDVLSRAVAYVIGKLQHRDVEIGINDNGFYIASLKNIQALRAFEFLRPHELRELMRLAVDKTEVLKRRFRHCAARALMILREYKGKRKHVGRQQVSSMILLNAVRQISHDFCILKEARREVLEDLMDIANAEKVLEDVAARKIELKQVTVTVPSPFAFLLATQGYTDILKMEEKIEFIRRMHQNVLAKIGKDYSLD